MGRGANRPTVFLSRRARRWLVISLLGGALLVATGVVYPSVVRPPRGVAVPLTVTVGDRLEGDASPTAGTDDDDRAAADALESNEVGPDTTGGPTTSPTPGSADAERAADRRGTPSPTSPTAPSPSPPPLVPEIDVTIPPILPELPPVDPDLPPLPPIPPVIPPLPPLPPLPLPTLPPLPVPTLPTLPPLDSGATPATIPTTGLL